MAKRRSKKYILSILTAVITVTLFTFRMGNVSAQVYPAGMISYWRFDEGSGTTAIDSVNANNGTVYGAIWTTGIVGSALSFDGVDDYIIIPDALSLRPEYAITIESWVKPMGKPGGPWSRGAWGKVIERDYSMWRYPFVSWSLGWYTGQSVTQAEHHPGDKFIFTPDYWYFQLLTEDGFLKYAQSSSKVTFGEWYHLAGVYNGSKVMLYVNGNPEGSSEVMGPIVYDINKLITIGTGRFLTQYELFNGLVDEVAIYNRALTPKEIEQHYQNGLNGGGYEELIIPATIDIDPDTLNLKSMGKWITCYIELPKGYDVTKIDVSTIMLNRQVRTKTHPTETGDYDNDDIADIMVKFDRSDVQNILDLKNGYDN